MLFFGHIGITLGAATLAAHSVSGRKTDGTIKASWFASLARYMDIRLLIIGSMLPDIIDKPLGLYIFKDTFNNGRIFAHTLLFLILITATGYILYKSRRHTWLLTIAAGSLIHLALDKMWEVPQTLFWPVLGFSFPQVELESYIQKLFQALLSSPYIYISEAIGLAVFIWFGIWLIYRKKVLAFIRHGKIY
jgi:inner membrane protein